jgi:hypothetical protein
MNATTMSKTKQYLKRAMENVFQKRVRREVQPAANVRQ